MENPKFLHSANANELANIAQEAGAEVLRGTLRYASETGGWQLGDVDLSEYLDRYLNREVVLVVASVSKAGMEKVTCGICGFILNKVGECPRCKLMAEETARDIEAKQEMQEALFREVEEILGRDGEHERDS
jgi:hypothetical protein